jgi:hypothetical protein
MNQQEQTSTETVLMVVPNSCGGFTGKNVASLIIRSRIFLVKIAGLHLAKILLNTDLARLKLCFWNLLGLLHNVHEMKL